MEDVLILSCSGATDTLYDVDCFAWIVRLFLVEKKLREDKASLAAITEEKAAGTTTASRPSAVTMVQVVKLVENYRAEVVSDANLKPAKFYELALALPDQPASETMASTAYTWSFVFDKYREECHGSLSSSC